MQLIGKKILLIFGGEYFGHCKTTKILISVGPSEAHSELGWSTIGEEIWNSLSLLSVVRRL